MGTWVGRRHLTAGPAPAASLAPNKQDGEDKVPAAEVAAELTSHCHNATPAARLVLDTFLPGPHQL